MEYYTKGAEIVQSWKNAYDNLNNQTKSGIFTCEDVDNKVKNVATPWQIAHQKEKKKQPT